MNPATRLIITKVILENFKSYAGIRQIGPFHTSFTAVVGPNGSGKSNLLESLLFAFGKRAKKMRLHKISELIHKSNDFPNLKFAKVEVHFENIDETCLKTVEGSQFTLSRTVFNNNSSIYKLNNSEISYESLTNLLKSKGIDLEHNRFLILQGEVEQIALMRPKSHDENKSGLLEYLEEIIGTDKYIDQIQSIEKEIEEISEAMISKKIFAEQASKAVSALFGPMQEAVTVLDCQHQILQYKNLKFQLFIHKNRSQMEILKASVSEVEEKITAVEKDYEEKKEKHSATVCEFEKKNCELETLRKQEISVEAQIAEIIKKDSKYTESIKEFKNKVKALREECEIETRRIEEIGKKQKETAEKIPILQEKQETIKTEMEIVDADFEKMNSKIMISNETNCKKKEEIEKTLEPLKREILKFRQDKEVCLQKVQIYLTEKRNQDSEVLKITDLIQKLSSEISQKSQEKQKTAEELAILSEKFIESSESLEKTKLALTVLLKNISEAKRTLSDIDAREKFQEGSSRLLREINDAKHKGILKGVIGRLGDLASIDAKYDIAVSSASNMFDYLVVEKVMDGEKVISFVREKNLGKVNIIILEKVQDFNHKNFVSPDSRCLRLFDLICMKNQCLVNAFYLALRDTLVTESLEVARVVALEMSKRWKVVTLDGDVINPTGEMMGFSRPISGKIKLASKNNKFSEFPKEKAQENLDELINNAEKLEKEIRNLENETSATAKKDSHLKNLIKLMENEINNKKENLESLKSSLNTVKSRTAEFTSKEVSTFEEIILKNEKNIEKIEKLAKIKESEIAKIESLIEQVGGEQFQEIKKHKEYLSQTEEKIQKEINEEKKKVHQFSKDSERYKAKVAGILDSIETASAKLLEFKGLQNDLLELAESKAAESKEICCRISAKTLEIKKFEAEKDLVRAEFHDLLVTRDKLREEKKDLLIKNKCLEEDCKIWNEKINLNRQEYLQQNFQVINEIPDLEHESKKQKKNEKLRFDVKKHFSQEELENLLSSLSTILDHEKELLSTLSTCAVNLSIIEEFEKKRQEKVLRESQLQEIKDAESSKKTQYLGLKQKRLQEFTHGFTQISAFLRDMYRKITHGGDAELEFADSTDPFSEGIVFTVRPPHKSWKKMSNLSGGEKTLASLALVFALHYYKPNALYVMDEVDAALDFQNVGIIANYIKARTKNAQFLVVSLRYQMFELADRLVGIYKVNSVSHCLTVSPHFFTEKPNQNPIIVQTVNNITVQ